MLVFSVLRFPQRPIPKDQRPCFTQAQYPKTKDLVLPKPNTQRPKTKDFVLPKPNTQRHKFTFTIIFLNHILNEPNLATQYYVTLLLNHVSQGGEAVRGRLDSIFLPVCR